MMLRQIVERLYELPPEQIDRDDALHVVNELKRHLDTGDIRAASPENGTWRNHAWVRKGIVLAFRIGQVVRMEAVRNTGARRAKTTGKSGAPVSPADGSTFQFFDKDTMGPLQLSARSGIRIVPGGTAVRDGVYLGKSVVIMPPSYVNIGAWVGEGTMIDSHVLVGSCAQVGERVHLSAGVQIGGVLEPVNSSPVIVEDRVFVGGNCGIFEGTLVRRNAILGAGVVLTGSVPVYDIPGSKVIRRKPDEPLTIPEGAVVLPGNRKIAGAFAARNNLSLYAPVIVKYRDERTDAATVLEESLR